jgi:hypothetical protein
MQKKKHSKWIERLIDEIYISIEEAIRDLGSAGINTSKSEFINKLHNKKYEVKNGKN